MAAPVTGADSAVIERLLAHNAWATRVLLDRCRELSPEQFARRFDIGPGSLHDTLLHVVGAMRRWADRVAGRALRPSVEDDEGARTPEAILALLDEADADLRAAARQVAAEGAFDAPIAGAVAREFNVPRPFTRGTALVHVLTHGVHHRAQALNMLRRLGVGDLPEIDAIEWELAP